MPVAGGGPRAIQSSPKKLSIEVRLRSASNREKLPRSRGKKIPKELVIYSHGYDLPPERIVTGLETVENDKGLIQLSEPKIIASGWRGKKVSKDKYTEFGASNGFDKPYTFGSGGDEGDKEGHGEDGKGCKEGMSGGGGDDGRGDGSKTDKNESITGKLCEVDLDEGPLMTILRHSKRVIISDNL